MPSVKFSRLLTLVSGILLTSALLTACGSGSEEQPDSPDATPNSTVISTPTQETLIADDVDEEDSGNIITRSLRTGGSWIWSGLTWVWDRGSDGMNAVWSGINAVSGFIWDNVTALPSTAWDAIKRFWNWTWGTNLGSSVAAAAAAITKIIAEINPIGFVQGVVSALVRILKISMAIAVGGLILFVIWRFRLLGVLVSTVFRRRAPSPRAIPKAETDWNHDFESPSRDSMSRNIAPLSSSSTSIRVDFENPGKVHTLSWTRTQIQELKARIANQTILTLFDLALARGGRPVNYRELTDATGRTREQVRADFAAFSRIAREVHRDESWPIEILPPTDEHSSRAYYVPLQYLDWWFED